MSDQRKALRVWQRVAPRYDRSMRFLERWQFAGGREWVCSRATGEVLEVAVGTGLNLPHYPAGIRLTGVDFSPAMLERAEARAAALGLEVELRQADAQRLPFEDRRFDTVVCTLSLCGIPDRAAAIGEMRRVLRPGGRLLLLDHIGSSWPPVWLVQRLLEAVTVRAAGEYQTRRQLGAVRDAGFAVQERERLKAGTVERIAAVKPVDPDAPAA
ncbi:methyltransferase family protein [Stackebrandtia albiflava]|uniref:Methyltransferase family protein n=1 Tax=Stackebrandtia albiflava TaxID=406432 RepID=A0A562VCG7_9ACTN|nr:class I SAM-dependent methyltransferase [Stackebrandtia albiflava]TWJ15560.1 methyltransferase family protein [Stackebrandtia albiflava]